MRPYGEQPKGPYRRNHRVRWGHKPGGRYTLSLAERKRIYRRIRKTERQQGKQRCKETED